MPRSKMIFFSAGRIRLSLTLGERHPIRRTPSRVAQPPMDGCGPPNALRRCPANTQRARRAASTATSAATPPARAPQSAGAGSTRWAGAATATARSPTSGDPPPAGDHGPSQTSRNSRSRQRGGGCAQCATPRGSLARQFAVGGLWVRVNRGLHVLFSRCTLDWLTHQMHNVVALLRPLH